MAKKIIIQYSANPVIGAGFAYNIYINLGLITYQLGFSTLNVDYIDSGTNIFPDKIDIQSSLTNTIANTVDFLRQNYTYQNITYSIVDNTIEVLINHDTVSIDLYEPPNSNISISIFDVPTETSNLIYYFQYKNIVGDDYLCGIYKKNYNGLATQVQGKAVLEKGAIKDHLDPIRGTGLSLELEASIVLNFDDLYTENEQDYMVRLFKNNKTLFVGFLKPDGIFQSFVRDNWIITLDCVDGLGALSNLSFVKSNGLYFIGKMKALDIVYYCLKRSGIELKINVSINVFYDGLTIDSITDILNNIYMNADRFYKNDGKTGTDGTVMSCEEVLKSVLDVFCACITQQDGEWYIFKPNELYLNQYVEFKRYDINNFYLGNVTKNLNKNLGGQIDNFYPHHCNENQQIEIKGGVSAFRLGYKYGYVSSLLSNPKLVHDSGLNYDGWTVLYAPALINDPTSDNGFVFKNSASGTGWVVSDNLNVLEGDLLTLKLAWQVNREFFTGSFITLSIKVGSYYLKYSPQNDQTPFEDAIQKSVWTTNASDTWTVFLKQTGSFEFPIPALPVDGNLTFKINALTGVGGTTIISSFDLAPTEAQNVEIGEFHTVSRTSKISSIVKENKTVYNGDNAGIIYLGAIFKNDETTPTELWYRKNFYESKSLLRLAAEEDLRIAQKPIKLFTGDAFGFLPYLSVISINNINGKFMPIDYSYDTMTNVLKLKLLELYSAEISDLSYKFTLDYGTTVKPTITS